MTCDEAEKLLSGATVLSGAEELQLQAHVAGCEACGREIERLGFLWKGLGLLPADEPGSGLRMRFYEALSAYRQGAEAKPRTWWPLAPTWQWAAAAAVFLAGLGTGLLMRPSEAPKEIVELRREVGDMRQMVALSLLQQQSASERLRGVSWAYRAEPSNTEVLSALVAAVNHDPNVNVRLAAVDALHAFASSPVIRRAVVDSLPKQQGTPLVQVALIDLMVDFKQREAAPELRTLASASDVNDGVKQRALWALEKLQ